MTSALLFPGQGAPAAGWRDAVAERAPDLLALARDLLDGEDPFDRFGAGTEFDQPAIYCATIAAYEIAGRPPADLHAGHSLGEVPALVCAGAIGERDGLRLVARRGRAMADAAARSGPGAMLAIRAPAAAVEADLDLGEARVANLNSPSQTVLSGPAGTIERIGDELAAAGVQSKRLAVAGAFHTPAMTAAAAELASFIAELAITEPAVPVISARTARPFADIGAELPASLVEPVRWIDVVAALRAAGVDRFHEVGPGKALSGLVRRCCTEPVTTATTPLPEALGA